MDILRDGMLERRPMQPEERAIWKRATKTAAQLMRSAVCATCGKPAPNGRILGSLASGTRYCSEDFEVARQRAERAAMSQR